MRGLGLFLGFHRRVAMTIAAPSGSPSLDFSNANNSQYVGQLV